MKTRRWSEHSPCNRAACSESDVETYAHDRTGVVLRRAARVGREAAVYVLVSRRLGLSLGQITAEQTRLRRVLSRSWFDGKRTNAAAICNRHRLMEVPLAIYTKPACM
jgi:hypothetical protein